MRLLRYVHDDCHKTTADVTMVFEDVSHLSPIQGNLFSFLHDCCCESPAKHLWNSCTTLAQLALNSCETPMEAPRNSGQTTHMKLMHKNPKTPVKKLISFA